MATLTRSVAMPQARAAASFEPRAKTRRPNTVRASTTVMTIASSSVSHTPGATSSHAGVGNVTGSSFTHVGGTLTVC